MQGAKWHSGFLTIALVLLSMWGMAQAPSATLTCREKLVQVGRPFEVELSVRHPERMIVVFPDTVKDFKPYEVHSGKPVPTSTSDGQSEDVKIYKLYTWEIDSVQHLQFPVRYLTAKGDTETVMSNVVDVEFQPSIPAYSDTLKLRYIEDLAAVHEPINWMAWGLIFAVLALVAAVAVIVFSKPIRKWLRRQKIEREWRKYLGQLQSLQTQTNDQQAYYAGLNKVWRLYFDRDWYLALGSRTTTELEEVIDQVKALDDADRHMLLKLSRTADMVLYADLAQPENLAGQFWNDVRAVMVKEYNRRREAAEV